MVSDRSLDVLRVIVQDYVASREPVGSKSIVRAPPSPVWTSMTPSGLLAYPLAWAGATWLEEGGRRRMRLWAGIGVVLLAVLTFEMLWYSP